MSELSGHRDPGRPDSVQPIPPQADPQPPAPAEPRRTIWFCRLGRLAAALLILGVVLLVLAALLRIEYAYTPPVSKLLNPRRINQDIAYDLWGRPVTHAEAAQVRQTEAGRAALSPANGAVPIDVHVLAAGRRAFYEETFGNEEFVTDVVGILDSPLSPWEFAKAVLKLRGRGTGNLRVRLARDAVVGGQQFREGQLVDTGLDVVPGTFTVMGMKIRYDRGRLQIGVSCAVCHSTVDMRSGKVVEGAPNRDLNIGLLAAMAPNSAGYFRNAEIPSLSQFVTERSLTVATSQGPQLVPDPRLLEDAVDRVLLSWPPGTFDSTTDLIANPSQIPDSFTWQDHPFGWTGFATAGPFRGLSVLNNNVHAMNSDGLSGAEASQDVFGWEKELTYAVILQSAVNSKYRWHPTKNPQASVFYASVDPTPWVPGMNQMVHLPTFVKGSLIAPDGLFISVPGSRVWFENNAMSAFQNTLAPPPPPRQLDPRLLARGQQVFNAAGCVACHSGPGYTNNRVLPQPQVGTSASRATANSSMWNGIVFPPQTWSWDTPVPLPAAPRALTVPTTALREDDVLLAYGQDEQRAGGFKVKGLVGLYWSPPYLHDSSIAVGRDAQTQVGLPGTLFQHIEVEPLNSLRALFDRDLRRRLIEVTAASERARLVNSTGTGHEHWVDTSTGFTLEDQDALIQYLISLNFAETQQPGEGAPRVADAPPR